MNRINNVTDLPVQVESFDDYDKLPPAIRRILQRAPYSICASWEPLKTMAAGHLEQAIDKQMPRLTRLAYGSSHPEFNSPRPMQALHREEQRPRRSARRHP